jgi:hypothetical protein
MPQRLWREAVFSRAAPAVAEIPVRQRQRQIHRSGLALACPGLEAVPRQRDGFQLKVEWRAEEWYQNISSSGHPVGLKTRQPIE